MADARARARFLRLIPARAGREPRSRRGGQLAKGKISDDGSKRRVWHAPVALCGIFSGTRSGSTNSATSLIRLPREDALSASWFLYASDPGRPWLTLPSPEVSGVVWSGESPGRSPVRRLTRPTTPGGFAPGAPPPPMATGAGATSRSAIAPRRLRVRRRASAPSSGRGDTKIIGACTRFDGEKNLPGERRMENERKRRCQVSCSAFRTRSSQSGGAKARPRGRRRITKRHFPKVAAQRIIFSSESAKWRVRRGGGRQSSAHGAGRRRETSLRRLLWRRPTRRASP